MFERIRANDRAQGLPEYALLVAVIVVMVVSITYVLYPHIVLALFSDTGDYIINSPQAEALR